MIVVEYRLSQPIQLGENSGMAREQFLANLSADTPSLSSTDAEFAAVAQRFEVRLPLSGSSELSGSTETALTTALEENLGPSVTHVETRSE